MTTLTLTRQPAAGVTSDERRVIFASSLGTVFEWYDFYLYATLAPFFAALFFPPGNDTAALLSAFATYAAGFLVRPFGALIFGRIGDLVGRKYTFLVTIVVMGGATFGVGLLPTFATIGWLAPILLVTLRLLQGLALGGEYGGAATYVAEHARRNERGYATSFIQTTATLGFFLALLVIGFARFYTETNSFSDWGWRIPFLVSLILLGVLDLHPPQAQRVAGVQAHEGGGQGLEGAAGRKLPALSKQQVRGARAARRHRRPGRGVVYGAVLRPVLPDHHAQARLCDGLCLDRPVARDRHAVLHLLRLAVGSHRAGQNHLGRLPDRGGHLLPAVRRLDPLRQSGAGGIPAEESDRRPVVEVFRQRSRPGLPHQIRPVVQVGQHARPAGRGDHRRDQGRGLE
jgi:hypothetical protein